MVPKTAKVATPSVNGIQYKVSRTLKRCHFFVIGSLKLLVGRRGDTWRQKRPQRSPPKASGYWKRTMVETSASNIKLLYAFR